jgi:hypothetical protein
LASLMVKVRPGAFVVSDATFVESVGLPLTNVRLSAPPLIVPADCVMVSAAFNVTAVDPPTLLESAISEPAPPAFNTNELMEKSEVVEIVPVVETESCCPAPEIVPSASAPASPDTVTTPCESLFKVFKALLVTVVVPAPA